MLKPNPAQRSKNIISRAQSRLSSETIKLRPRFKTREQNADEVLRFCRLNYESFGDIITVALFLITTNPYLQKNSGNVTAKKSLSRSHFAVWDPVAFAVAGKLKKSRKLRWHQWFFFGGNHISPNISPKNGLGEFISEISPSSFPPYFHVKTNFP